MATEEQEPKFQLPPHETLISETAVIAALKEVIEAKRGFATTVKAITGSIEAAERARHPRFFSAQEQVGDVDAIMQPAMAKVSFANGISHALDILAPIADGRSWDTITTELAEAPSEPGPSLGSN